MENFTALPLFVSTLFNYLPNIFRNRHKLVFCWLILLQSSGISATNQLKSLSHIAPNKISEWHFRRLLTASYWSIKVIMTWLSEQVINQLPKPDNFAIYLTVDGSKKEKRTKKNPFAQAGKIRSNHAYFFGIKFVVLMVHWGNFRIPVDFEIVWPKKSQFYESENQLFRNMLNRYQAPSWAKQIFVLGDAGFASKKNFSLMNQFHTEFKTKNIHFWYVFAISKTWKTEDGHFIKNYARHIKKELFIKNFICQINQRIKRAYWCFRKPVCLREVGDVTMILSRKRRNSGPKSTKILVTNHPTLTSKQVIEIYQRRFLIEVLFRELKSHMGLGKHQVTKNIHRIRNSFGIGFISYLFLLRVGYSEIPETGSWSILKLQNKFREKIIQDRFKNSLQKEVRKLKKAA